MINRRRFIETGVKKNPRRTINKEKIKAITIDEIKIPWKSLSELFEKLLDILWEDTDEIPGSTNMIRFVAAIAVNHAP